MPEPKSKKKNVPKFVLAKNDSAAPGKTYIVHTQEPSFIAEILTFSKSEDASQYMMENCDIEFIEVTPLVLIEMKKYLVGSEGIRDKAFLAKRLKHWTIVNFIDRNAFLDGQET